jgi:ATP-dependent Clp protease ATP-binding subunit ClpA
MDSVKTAQAAQGVFRCQLKNNNSILYGAKWVTYYCFETLLYIPVVRLATLVVLRVLSIHNLSQQVQKGNTRTVQVQTPPAPSVQAQTPPAPLIELWEQEMRTPTGITTAPPNSLKKAPPLPATIKYLPLFARDLTLEAERGELRPFFGREKEFRQVAEILGRNQKSNPLLLGAPGVGKTSIPAGIAQKIVKDEDDLPLALKGKRVFLLQWERMTAINKRSSESDDKVMSAILNEAIAHKESVIIFIDEIHAFLNGKNNVSNILKPALADGTFSCIVATTPWDYQKLLDVDPSLERRFPQVIVQEPSDKEMH